MFQLPFHFDRPLAAALLIGAASLAFFLLWIAYVRDLLHVRSLLAACFRRVLARYGPERATRFFGIYLLGMALLFAANACFALLVGTGVIRNGEPRRPKRLEGSEALRGFLDREGGTVNVKELVEKNRRENPRNDAPTADR